MRATSRASPKQQATVTREALISLDQVAIDAISGGPAAASFRALVGADLQVPFTVPGPVTINT
jgi:hypothetical protein